MASLRTLAPLAGLVASASAGLFDAAATCSNDLPYSCQNSTAVEDTCCFVSAGQVVLTQFWDTEPVTGPVDSWTIHGLWVDWCDGTYPAECDDSRAYTNISDILTANGKQDTLDYMSTYWKDYEGDDESFWEHEWAKHGTCVSTLEPDCYDNYEPTQEAAAYFEQAVATFKKLPTYEWLAEAGITPSDSETYDADKIASTLEEKHGAPVYLGCDGDALNEVWYHFNVKGSLQDGEYRAVEPTGTEGSSCSGSITYASKGSNGTVAHWAA